MCFDRCEPLSIDGFLFHTDKTLFMPTIDFYVPSVAVLDVSHDVPHGLDGFKDNCLWDGEVICGWEVLEGYLVDGRIASYWWYLTTEDRFAIAEKAVTNTLFYYISQYGRGDADCAGNVVMWDTAVCGHNAAVRILKFSSLIGPLHPYDPVDRCYYKDSFGEHCFIPDKIYSLPCYWVTWTTSDVTHSMCAIQIGEDVSSLDSWYIFQYAGANIRHGDPQMGGSGTLEIGKVDSLACAGCNYIVVAEFIL